MTRLRPAQQRHLDRAARLGKLRERGDRDTTIDGLARAAREKLWVGRPRGGVQASGGAGEVLLRSGLILRNGHPTSPLLDVAERRGAAVQLLLVALFAAQCRRPASAGFPTDLLLRNPTDPSSTSWRYLVALQTTDTRRTNTASRSPTENRLAQLRTALTGLHECGRVELAKPSGRGRFERFRLLNESTYRPGETVYYSRPRRDEPVLRVPVEFFLRGWVHALTDSEVAAYLFLLFLQQQNPPANPDEGTPVPLELWNHAFPTERGHIGYRMLFRFGLIRYFRQAARRDDGTIEDLNEFDYLPDEPLSFIVDPDALHADALEQVLPALERAAAGTRLDEAYAASQGVEI